MTLINNLFIIFFLILIIIIVIKEGVENKDNLNYKKKPKKNTHNLDLCFKNCNKECDTDLSPRFYDACMRKCAIRCGNKFS